MRFRFSLVTILMLSVLIGCNTQTVKTDSNAKEPSSTPQEESGNDVLAAEAWHLENKGQTAYAGAAGTSGQDLSIAAVIEKGYKGKGIKIAVSDSGVDLTHPDLNDNALSGQHRDYSTSASSDWQASGANPYPDEGEGHGTAVTGLIAAEGWNTIGSRGVAPKAKFAGFYFIGDFGDTVSSYEAKTIDQILGNFDIFNYSYGYSGCTFVPVEQSIIDTYKEGVTSLRGGRGAIYVKAAGNDFIGSNKSCYGSSDTSGYLGNTNTNEDQNVPYVIVTAAVNALGQISSYSTPGSGVWISSAGGEFGYSSGSNNSSYYGRKRSVRGPAMISTDIVGCSDGMSTSSSDENDFNSGDLEINSNCDYTNVMNGTSSAAPTLSGIVALMLEANPNLTWRDVKHILATTADKINYSPGVLTHPGGNDLATHAYDFVYITNFAGYRFSNTYGFGRVNANKAVVAALSYVSGLGTYKETENPNNSSWYYDSGTIALTIPDVDSDGITSTITVRHNYIIEAVQIEVSTDHTFIGDLGIELVSPKGTRSKLLLINSNIKDSGLSEFKLLTNAFYGEESYGNWKINVIDGAANDTGDLTNWKIKINGHRVSGDSTAPAAVTGIADDGIYSSTTSSPEFTFTGSVSSDIARYEVAVGTAEGLEDKAKWYSIGLSTTFTVTGLSLTGDDSYFVKIRAIDKTENVSSQATSSWVVGP